MDNAASEFFAWQEPEPLIQSPIAKLDHHDSTADGNVFQRRCDEFDRLLPYARNPLVANPDIAGRSVEVNNRIGDIRKMIAELEKNMIGLKESIRIVPGWYEAGDLLYKPVIRLLHKICS